MPIYMKNLNYQIRGFSERDQMVVGYHVYLIQLYIIKVVWCFCKVFQFFFRGGGGDSCHIYYLKNNIKIYTERNSTNISSLSLVY